MSKFSWRRLRELNPWDTPTGVRKIPQQSSRKKSDGSNILRDRIWKHCIISIFPMEWQVPAVGKIRTHKCFHSCFVWAIQLFSLWPSRKESFPVTHERNHSVAYYGERMKINLKFLPSGWRSLCLCSFLVNWHFMHCLPFFTELCKMHLGEGSYWPDLQPANQTWTSPPLLIPIL